MDEPETSDTINEAAGREGLVPLAVVADRFGLEEQQLNRWIASGSLRAYRDRGEVHLVEEEVRRFLDTGRGDDDRGSPTEGGNFIALPELARFLGVDPGDLDELIAGGTLEVESEPGGPKRVRRDEVARLFLGSAGRAALIQVPGTGWPEGGEPDPILGEGALEEADEEITEETQEQEAAPMEPTLRGAVTLRYYSRMTIRRSFPLLLQAARLSGPVRAVPRLPGCLCVPPGIDLTEENARGEFWITPQALGPVPKAAVDFLVSGEVALEVRTPIEVRSLAGAWALLALAGFFLLLAPFTGMVDAAEGRDSPATALMDVFGGPVATALFLSLVFFIAGAGWFFWAAPREARPQSASLSGR